MSFTNRYKSSYQSGKERKNKIVETIKNATVMTSRQVQTIHFSSLKPNSAKRKCQEVLKELVDEGRLKCYHNPKQQFVPAYYYIDQKPKNLTHFLTINEVLCEFVRQKPPLFKIEWVWSYIIYNGMVIADAMITLSYDPDGKKKQVIMLEVECDPKKRFDKDTQYQKVYNKDWHIDLPEWVIVEKENEALFPDILIVSDKEIKLKPTDVNFIVATPEQVTENVYKLIWRD